MVIGLDDILESRFLQALIAGGVVALGWVYNGRANRLEAARLRAEKLRDAHRAIFAEIATNLSNLWDEGSLRDYGREMAARMEEDPGFVPLIPRERNDRLFETIKTEIHILPRVTIDPIVQYYSQLDAIAALVDDMRGEAFKALTPDRRIDMYLDYIEMRVQALAYGRLANYLIEVYSADGKEAAEAEARRLKAAQAEYSASSPSAGRSDP